MEEGRWGARGRSPPLPAGWSLAALVCARAPQAAGPTLLPQRLRAAPALLGEGGCGGPARGMLAAAVPGTAPVPHAQPCVPGPRRRAALRAGLDAATATLQVRCSLAASCRRGCRGPSVGTAPCPCSSCLSPSAERGRCAMGCPGGWPGAALARLLLLLLLLGVAVLCSAGEAVVGSGTRLRQPGHRCSSDALPALWQGWGSRAPPSMGSRWQHARCGRRRAVPSPAGPPGWPLAPRWRGTSMAGSRRQTALLRALPAPSPSPPGAPTASSTAP